MPPKYVDFPQHLAGYARSSKIPANWELLSGKEGATPIEAWCLHLCGPSNSVYVLQKAFPIEGTIFSLILLIKGKSDVGTQNWRDDG
jgi:hypothetical protein